MSYKVKPNWYIGIFLFLVLLSGCSETETVVNKTVATVVKKADKPILTATKSANTPTPKPTNTPTPEPTNIPTPEPTVDSNLPLTLPFSDNFDNGLNPQWRVIGIPPLIVDGKMTTPKGKESVVEIGNNLLKDYTLEFTLSEHGCCDHLCLFISPIFKMDLQADGMSSRVSWFNFIENEWVQLVSSDNFDIDKGGARIKLVVSGNTYRLYVAGQLVSEVIYGQREIGAPLGIKIEDNSIRIDDLVIK